MNGLPDRAGTLPEADDANALMFVTLGGANEIGMNLSLYGCAGDWLILDCGVTFGDDSQPGLDVVMPDPAFIAERPDRLLGFIAARDARRGRARREGQNQYRADVGSLHDRPV